MVISLRSPGMRRTAVALFAVMVLPTLWLGMRTYRSLLVLHSAYEAGAPATGGIRGWMTLSYIAATYHVPVDELRLRLELPPGTDPNTSLRLLAERSGRSPPGIIERVQRAITAATPAKAPAAPAEPPGWFASAGETILTQLLVYGLPVLALSLFLGAIGVPLPTGIAAAVAGSLAAQGRMDWSSILAVAAMASVLGDLVAYAIGRLLGGEVLDRHGHWIGYTPPRRARMQALFDQWGALTVFITRTFVSSLSSVVSLIAGVAHYRLSWYLGVAALARLVWAGAYVGLGYAVGSDLEAASGFLTNLSLLLVCAVALAASGAVASGLTLQPNRSAT
jgi:membrane protein DedA with SNARE-associated domain